MFRPQMLAIFRLYNKNLPISYTCVCMGCVGCRGKHSRDIASVPPAPYTPHTDACITDWQVFIVQPEDGQHLWPKHVVVLYI